MAEIIGNELLIGFISLLGLKEGSEETSSVTVVMRGLGVINPKCAEGVI